MRNFAKIAGTLWGSRKFRALPSDDARLLYLYVHTCPHANSIGTYWLPEGYALVDLIKWDAERFQAAISACCKVGLIDYDGENEVIRIIGFLNHSEIINGKHGMGAVRLALGLPNSPQKTLILKELLTITWCAAHLAREGMHCPEDTGQFCGSDIHKDMHIDMHIPTETETETKNPAPVGTAPQAAASPKGEEPDLQSLGDGDPAKLAFDYGLPWLRWVYPDTKDSSLRSLIGGWKRDYGPEATWRTIVAAQARMHSGNADDPRAWIIATLKAQKRKNEVGASVMPSTHAAALRNAVEGLRDGKGWVEAAFGKLPGSPGADPWAEKAAAEMFGDDWREQVQSLSRRAA